MPDQWYYTENRKRRGPVSDEQLKQLALSCQLKPTDLVWRKGMTGWQQASEIEGLIPAKEGPPPLPAEDEPPPVPPDPTAISPSKQPEQASILDRSPRTRKAKRPPPANLLSSWKKVSG